MKKRKVLVGLLVASAALGLTACGGGEDDKKPNDGQQETQQYTVEFSVNGGSAVASQTITEGGKVTKPTNPTKANHTFAGWYKDATLQNEFKFDTDTISAATTLYAKWTINSYAVTFNSLGGTEVASTTVNHGGKVTKPTNPTKDGFVFVNWYKEEACTTVFDFQTDTITAATTLYAGWEVQKNLVTFNSLGGSEVQQQNVELNGKATKPTNPTKEGYVFVNWYKEEVCTNVFDFENETITGDITLYAKWEIQKNLVTFNSLGGTAVDSQNIDYGAKATKPADPTKEGVVFTNWYKEEACTNVFNFETEVITAETTLFAGYRDKTYADLVADSNVVIHDDFTTTTTIEDFSGTFGTKGIYQHINLKGTTPDKTANYIAVENGAAKMHDTTSDGTQMMIDFGGKLNNGTIEGVMDLTLSGTGNSWTFFQIIGTSSAKSSSEIFGIRTDSGQLKYRLDGGSAETPASTIANSDIKYSIYFIVDIENSKLLMRINGQIFVDITFDVTSLEGIRLVSSDNGSRTMTIDNIAVVQTQLALDAYKEKQGALLQAYYDSLDLSVYVTNKATLDSTLEAGKTAIAQKTTHAEVLQAYEEADKALRAILNDTDQQLQDHRLNVLSEIDKLGSFEGIYTSENLSIVQGYIEAAIAAINAVKITETVDLDAAKQVMNDAMTTLTTEIAKVKTIAQQNEEAAEEIRGLITALVAADATRVELLAAEEDILAARTAYDAATDAVKALISDDLVTKLTDVEVALEEAKNSATPQETVLSAVQDAKDDLDATYKAFDLTQYVINGASLQSIINEAKADIDALVANIETDIELTDENAAEKYITPITNLVTQCKTDLDAVLTDLEQKQDDLLVELKELYESNVSKYTAEYNLEAYIAKYAELKEAIEVAETIDALNQINILELDEVLTDEEQIAYDNKPEIGVNELVTTRDEIDFVSTKPVNDVKYAQGEKNSFITFKSVNNAKHSKGGYLSIKDSTISFTTKYADARLTITYTSTSADRKFTLNGVTYTPATDFVSKTKTITLGSAGTYDIVYDATEHKIGYFILEDKEVKSIQTNVDSIEATLSKTEYLGTEALLNDLKVKATLENKSIVDVDNSIVSVKYLQNNEEVTDIISGLYDVEVSYKDTTHTGIVKSVIRDVSIVIATAVKDETELLAALDAGDTHIQLLNDVEVSARISITKDVTIHGNGYAIIASDMFEGASVIYNNTTAIVELNNVTIDANDKTRVITVSSGQLKLIDSTVTRGYTTDYIAGIYVTNSASFISVNSDITGNVINGEYSADNYLQYSADLWIGANAQGAVQSSVSGGNIGSIFVNANEYSSQNPGGFTLDGCTVGTVYVEYDKGYGASFVFSSGKIENLLISTTTSGESVNVEAVPQTTYIGGKTE